MNDIPIAQGTQVNYLGLIVDDILNWSDHIQNLKSKIIPMLGALCRCSKYLNFKNRLLIHNAYILSNIRYLIRIWGTCGLSYQKIQMHKEVISDAF